jgi:Amt family ammonium transporter
VHLVCGIFGIIAVGLFAHPDIMKQWVNSTGEYCHPGLFNGGGFGQLGVQLLGIGAICVTVFAASMIFFAILKATLGIRVSPEEELEGLDIGEHGMEAYVGFAGEPSREMAVAADTAGAHSR